MSSMHGINLTIADTGISKQMNLRFYSNHDVIYIQGQQQGDQQQCSVAHQTKQVPIVIWHHSLQPFIAYCTDMNRSILKFFRLWHIHGVCISEIHEEVCQRPSRFQYECIYLTSCIQKFSPIFYYCDQLSFTATVLPESMLPV